MSRRGKLPVLGSGPQEAPRRALVFVGHGSRVASANESFEAVVSAFRREHPELAVSHGYVELAAPSLESALGTAAQSFDEVLVVPLFLFAAGHVKNDIPLALHAARSAHPAVRFLPTGAIGVHPELIQLARLRVEQQLGGAPRERTAVLFAGRGSSDPDANADFCKVARLVGEGGSFATVMHCFLGVAEPSLEQALELLVRSRPERIVVAPYLLFSGRLTQKLSQRLSSFAQRSPWTQIVQAEALGNHPRLQATVLDRVQQALGQGRPLACDTCQYRVPVGRVTDRVGGLQALLWSLRHSFTHTQAMPHEHAHAPLAKHVLVCGNVDCADRGSIALISRLRRLVKRAGRAAEIRVTRTHCMGRCGEGPTVAVYPDGVWYRGVREEDAQQLVEEHLLGDRLVGRLVDNIMQ